MSKHECTRRDFLQLVVSGITGVVTGSCRSTPERASGKQSFTFVQLCDSQLGMGGYEHDVESLNQAVAQINNLNPDFVVICGDLVHDANERSFADFKRIRATLDVPCYCAPGNHDVGGTSTVESLNDYRRMIGEDYYSFEHKGYAFVFVNTQLWKVPVDGESGKQDAWLAQTLKTAVKKRSQVFIVGHYPLFLEKLDEPEKYMNLPLAKRTELLNLFERHNVVAVLGGHAHRLIINDYCGIQLVNGESTSKNFDHRPLGFRVWQVTKPGSVRHEFVSLEGF